MGTWYDDIIHLLHHVSKTNPHMSMVDQVAQLFPFAALPGYDDEIKEAGWLTDESSSLLPAGRRSQSPPITMYFRDEQNSDLPTA